jgi:hypothetical protein
MLFRVKLLIHASFSARPAPQRRTQSRAELRFLARQEGQRVYNVARADVDARLLTRFLSRQGHIHASGPASAAEFAPIQVRLSPPTASASGADNSQVYAAGGTVEARTGGPDTSAILARAKLSPPND